MQYDNEWGYTCRVADLLKFLCDKGPVMPSHVRGWPAGPLPGICLCLHDLLPKAVIGSGDFFVPCSPSCPPPKF